MRAWLPLRTSLALAALAALALAALTIGLLGIVSRNAAELALVRAEAEADVIASKVAGLAGLSPEERAAEIETLAVARAMEATDGGRCDSHERSRALVLIAREGQKSIGTQGLEWPAGASAGEVRFTVPAGVACQQVPVEAIGVVRDLRDDMRLLSARIYSPDPELKVGAALLALGIFVAFLALALAFATAVTRAWQRRIEAINTLLDRADALGFSERAETGSGPAELRSLGLHLNALLGRASDMIEGLGRLHRHVAHDLRGPLMVARKHLARIGEGADAPVLAAEVEERLATMDKRCRVLLGIIDAEATRRGVEDPLDPGPRIERLVEDMFVYLGDDKELQFAVEAAPAGIAIHPDQFDRMIENLLGNAVKFADPHSTIRIAVRTQGPSVSVSVENDGPHVPDRNLERIFEPGYSDAGASAADSHGLGLAFVRTVALRAGGDAVARNLERGFRVEISLPNVMTATGQGGIIGDR